MKERCLTLRDLARLLDAAGLAPEEFIRRVRERDPQLERKLLTYLWGMTRRVRLDRDEIATVREILNLSHRTVKKLNARKQFECPEMAQILSFFAIPLPQEIHPIVREVIEDAQLGRPWERNFLKNWGAVISSHRRALGLTQAQLAYHSKISQSSIARIEQGSLSVAALYYRGKALDKKLERLVRTLLKIAKAKGKQLPDLQRLYDVAFSKRSAS